MNEIERRTKYLAILALPSDDSATTHGKALARAHDLRKFEIANYWTRSTYFWGFQLVAFGALAIAANEGRIAAELVLIVAVISALTAFAAVLTAYGSKFWQENWERHVDMLEPAEEGRLAQTVLAEDLSFSVSRVNERLLEFFLFGWLLAMIVASATLLCPNLRELRPGTAAILQVSLSIAALVLGGVWILKGRGLPKKLLRSNHAQRSSLADRAYNYQTMTKMPNQST